MDFDCDWCHANTAVEVLRLDEGEVYLLCHYCWLGIKHEAEYGIR